jgi:hypothetical protein
VFNDDVVLLRIKEIESRIDSILISIAVLNEKSDKVHLSIELVKREMSSNRGFFSGIVLACAASFALIGYLITWHDSHG